MATSTIKQLPKQTVEIEMVLPWEEIKWEYQKVFDEVAKEMELPGFRKGKAPKKLVEENINRSKVYEEVLKRVVPKVYADAIKQNNLEPISSPKVEVLEAKENIPWKLKATIALKPKINLKNYKAKMGQLNKSKKANIWIPGKDKQEDLPAGRQDKKDTKASIGEIMDILVSEVEIELPDLLVTEEINKLLSSLIDQTARLGMTVEQYTQAKGTTTARLRDDYRKEAIKNLTVEFALAEIADKENITVTPQDIENLITKVEKKEEQDKLRSQSYYLAHLIRQQKTIDYLSSL
ncbi:hypothetical protein HYW54_03810 [Candidatus Gottesmanbacteria bacterium]|nr:hypothetical protein [Candidatus Gottesmanbacteria bacterium]